MAKTREERFWSRVERGGPDECWQWTGSWAGSSMDRKYGRFGKNPSIAAHRFAYELMVGPIPEGFVLDHLCKNTLCVNPAHVEVVSVSENTMRGNGLGASNARRTHCRNGHPLTGDNLIPHRIHPEWRNCRQCRRERDRRRYAREKARILDGEDERKK